MELERHSRNPRPDGVFHGAARGREGGGWWVEGGGWGCGVGGPTREGRVTENPVANNFVEIYEITNSLFQQPLLRTSR
jgi:hypothetical protein